MALGDAGAEPLAEAASASARTLRFTEKRERILDGAARLFNARGIKSGTLAELAEQVGLATNSLTYYYRRKEDLVAACLMRAIDSLQAMVDQADAQPDLDGRVRTLVNLFVGQLSRIQTGEAPELIFFSDMRALPQPQAEPVFAAYTALFRSVRRLLREEAEAAGSPAGEVHAEAQRLARNARAHLLLTLTLWTRAWIRRFEQSDHAHAARQLADVLLNGLAASAAPPGSAGPASHQAWVTSERVDLIPAGTGDPTRDAYLRTAIRMVNAQGVGGASVERIAAELALTKGSFYHHHATKDELIAACLERTFGVIRQALAAGDAHGGSGWQRLLQALLPLARFQLSGEGPLLRVTAWNALVPALRHEAQATMGRLGERFGTVIVGGMVDGSIRVTDVRIAAQQLSGMISGLAEVEMWVPGVTADNVAELYARPLLFGLASGA